MSDKGAWNPEWAQKRIDELESRLAEARAFIDLKDAQYKAQIVCANDFAVRAEKADAQVAALAEALQFPLDDDRGCPYVANRLRQEWYEKRTKARAALSADVRKLVEQAKRLREDAALLDWWEEHLEYEHGQDYETGEVVIYRVTGGVNDREWHEVSRAATLREALRGTIEGAGK